MTFLATRTSAFLTASAAVHTIALVGLGGFPRLWPFWLGAVGLNHAALLAGTLIPKSTLLSVNLTHLPLSDRKSNRVALTFDDGPDAKVTPKVLQILEQRKAPATFFCIGRRVAQNPDLVTSISVAGHRLGNHTWSHPHAFWFSSPRKLSWELDRTQDLLESLSGCPPKYFRAPAGIRSPLLEPLLIRRRLRLVSWSRRGYDSIQQDPKRVLARLTEGLSGGEIILLHDGSSALTREGVPIVLEVLPPLLDFLEEQGLEPALLP
jgi:peptidoglycan/xylan/chitin deacetylase (PgdA/CDA1 family)